MKRSIITTADGSKTIQIEHWNEQYHSIHGAFQEAKHVYIEMGLGAFVQRHPQQKQLTILEIGFGTGLNAMLTATNESTKQKLITYHGIEAYPVSNEELQALNYTALLSSNSFIFDELHKVSWNTVHKLTPFFTLKKRKEYFADLNDLDVFDVVYFDAFGPRVQPELWTTAIFELIFKAMHTQGILVTYSAKGSVRRALQQVGFEVERLPGPPGKREMLRATKIS